jgi:hypothetical protein
MGWSFPAHGSEVDRCTDMQRLAPWWCELRLLLILKRPLTGCDQLSKVSPMRRFSQLLAGRLEPMASKYR